MNPGFRLALLGGCVLVAALVSPHSARVVTEDVLGPYALRRAVAGETDLARSVPVEGQNSPEALHDDAHGDHHPEDAHDAP
ncbi:MAG: hypothetical protein NTY35_11225 [Planctomycetota bacterium]|nr:hypothetical protein [Planctomycetota bacterium]